MEESGLISRDRMVLQSTVSRIPCEIKYSGSAPVSDYFVVNDDNKVKEGMFRGRLLKGERVSLPDDIEGLMIVKKKDNLGKTHYEAGASFNEMTDWNTDTIPEKPSPSSISSCIQWMEMMSEIHSMEEQSV